MHACMCLCVLRRLAHLSLEPFYVGVSGSLAINTPLECLSTCMDLSTGMSTLLVLNILKLLWDSET